MMNAFTVATIPIPPPGAPLLPDPNAPGVTWYEDFSGNLIPGAGTFYDIVAMNIESVITVADNIDTVVQAVDAAANAANSATAAAANATAAGASATAAAGSAVLASNASVTAQNAAVTATTAAGTATLNATSATQSAAAALVSQNAAAGSASTASIDATNAVNAWMSFRGVWYGPFPTAPLLDPNGNPPTPGDVYFDTSLGEIQIWNGLVWQGLAASSLTPADVWAALMAYTGQYNFLRPVYYNGNALITAAQVQATYVPLAGGTLTGALMLAGNAAVALQAVPYQQLNSAIAAAVAGYLPLAGGALTGALALAANATQPMQPTTYQQMNAAIAAIPPPSLTGYLPLTGGTLTGALTLAANATLPMQPVAFAQMTGALGGYLPLTGGTLSGSLSAPYLVGTSGVFNIGDGSFGFLQSGGLKLFNWAAGGWYDAWNPANGNRTWVGSPGNLMTLDGGGNLTTLGGITGQSTVQGANVVATNAVFSVGGLFNGGLGANTFGFFSTAGYENFQFAASWIWQWNTSSGQLSWQTPGGALWNMRASDNLCWNGLGSVGGMGPYADLSDERAKEDITPADHGLDVVMQLEPVQFRRKQWPNKTGRPRAAARTELGFIAQAVRDILPEAVMEFGTELPDGGGTFDSGEPSLGMTTTTLVAVLVNAVKELNRRLEALEDPTV